MDVRGEKNEDGWVRRVARESLFIPLLLLALLTVLLVSPAGDFPLNDDWIYAQAVQGILEDGHFSGHPYSTALLVVQAYWGALFCSVFGFSFVVLRCSTLVLWLAGAWAAARCGKECGLSRGPALLAGVVVLANPLVINLSYTFMTDVPFLALSAFSGLFFLRALREPKWQWVALGSAIAAAAFFVRQFAVLVPAAYAVTVSVQWLRTRSKISWPYVGALAIPWVVAAVLLPMVPSAAGELGHTWDPDVLGKDMGARISGGIRFVLICAMYLCLFLFPIILAGVLRRRPQDGLSAGARWSIFAGLFASALYIVHGEAPGRMPFYVLYNMIYDFGVGPLTLRGLYQSGALWRPVQIGDWWWVPTLIGIGLACIVLRDLASRSVVMIFGSIGVELEPDAQRARQELFLLIWGAFIVVALFNPWLPVRFDRYLIAAVVPVGVLLTCWMGTPRKGGWMLAGAGCVLLYGFSVVCLQDYMAWNTARWTALERLATTHGVPDERIDGGYEFNGLRTSGGYIERDGASSFLKQGPIGWWIVDDAYAVSLIPREGYSEIGREGYFSWLGFRTGQVLMLRRDEDAEGPR